MFKRIFLAAIITAYAAMPVLADPFPLTMNHKYGTTVIKQVPQRVVTLDWAGADDLLALGVQPLTTRKWVCFDQPYAVCPWAQDLLTSEPLVLGKDYSLDYEVLASTNPDLIIALWSGITDKDYLKLSELAPVVAVPEGVNDFGLPWDERAILTGKALGKQAEAEKLVDEINAQFKAATCPEWQGKTAAIGFVSATDFGAIANNDPSMQIMRNLGFVLPDSLAKDAADVDYLPLSAEEIGRLDADLLLWINTGDDNRITSLTGYDLLKAHQEGREILLDKELNNAFRHATLLSLPYAIDKLVPQIKKAIGGCES